MSHTATERGWYNSTQGDWFLWFNLCPFFCFCRISSISCKHISIVSSFVYCLSMAVSWSFFVFLYFSLSFSFASSPPRFYFSLTIFSLLNQCLCRSFVRSFVHLFVLSFVRYIIRYFDCTFGRSGETITQKATKRVNNIVNFILITFLCVIN